MKTITEIANGLGLPRQRIYRYIKRNSIQPSSMRWETMLFDADVQERIFHNFYPFCLGDPSDYARTHHEKPLPTLPQDYQECDSPFNVDFPHPSA